MLQPHHNNACTIAHLFPAIEQLSVFLVGSEPEKQRNLYVVWDNRWDKGHDPANVPKNSSSPSNRLQLYSMQHQLLMRAAQCLYLGFRCL